MADFRRYWPALAAACLACSCAAASGRGRSAEAENKSVRWDRPDFSAEMRALVEHMVKNTADFSHVDPDEVLFVASGARRGSRATARPTLYYENGKSVSPDGLFRRPKIKVGGRKIKYTIELRPKFFLDSTIEDRLVTLVHELFHVSDRFDGTLAPEHEHEVMGREDFDGEVLALVNEYLPKADAGLLKPFGYDGEVMVDQWLERPPKQFRKADKHAKKTYRDRDLFSGPVIMKTLPSEFGALVMKGSAPSSLGVARNLKVKNGR